MISKDFHRNLETDVLARTLWGEARGESTRGMEAVAWVVLNRVAFSEGRAGYWWGNTIVQVCQKSHQFSCWNRSDANFRKILAVDEKDVHFATALRIARRAVLGLLKDDPTHGATHYHAIGLSPHWAKGQEATAVIGKHVFYRTK